jgi:hypothetical protein
MFASTRSCLMLTAAATLAASCGDGPTTPTAGASSAPSALVRLELVAPGEVAPGASIQLTANAVNADGSVKNVTRESEWTLQSIVMASVLTVSGTGIATGGQRGRGVVVARFGGLTAEATIFVLPEGTFRLAGSITDEGAGVENATVTVILGVGEGLSALTDGAGEYELYGVAGPVQIRASKHGYSDRFQQVDVTAHRSLRFELTPYRPWDNYAGDYRLTLVGGRCTPDFPEALKTRAYSARIEQAGAQLRVHLSGAKFWHKGDAFQGVVAPSGEITFTIRPVSIWDYDAFDFFEDIADGPDLMVGGIIVARSTRDGIFGKGEDEYFGGYMRPNLANGVCDVERFELVRH